MRAAQHGEDRGAVGRGDRGADDQSLERAEVEQPLGGEAGDHRGDQGPDYRQRERRPDNRPDLLPAGGQATLEEDQQEPDRAQRPGQLGIIEVDPEQAVGADQHAETEEEHQAGNPDPIGDHRGADAGGEQQPADQDQLGILHLPPPPRSVP